MKIVFLEPIEYRLEELEQACQGLIEQGHEVIIYPDKRAELNLERAAGADIIVQTDMQMEKSFFESCPNLKMLAIAITGLDHIDLEACAEHNIIVNNAAGYSTNAVAELTISMMLSLYRHLRENDRATRNWQGHAILPGRELSGKTVGIAGLGAIGRRTAELAQAFGCRILAWSQRSKNIEGVEWVSKETLLAESDIISLHLALTEETINFLRYDDLLKMKRSAILINTARGAIVNNTDLARALNEGVIAGAALDVYDGEPPLFFGLPPMKKENPLLSAPNTLLLPHIGFGTQEAKQLRLKLVMENIHQFIKMNS